jgi:hypothetical protein
MIGGTGRGVPVFVVPGDLTGPNFGAVRAGILFGVQATRPHRSADHRSRGHAGATTRAPAWVGVIGNPV